MRYRKIILIIFVLFFTATTSASIYSAVSQSDWNTGSFNGTSSDRNSNSGSLGIGYLNGTNRNTGLEKDLIGYWRFDRTNNTNVPDTVIDDFEYADDTAFNNAYTTNDAPDDWLLNTTTNITNGNKAMWGDPPGGGGDAIWSFPSDGTLNYYPKRGDKIVYYVTQYGPSTSEKNRVFFFFGMNQGYGTGDFYQVVTDWSDGQIELQDPSGTQVETNIAFEPGQTYRVEIDWDTAETASGEIETSIYEKGSSTSLGTIAMTDTTYDSGGIGFNGDWDPDHTAVVDYLHKEGVGTHVKDYSGSENGGSTFNSPSRDVQGIFGTNAFSFNSGNDEYVNISNEAAFDIGTEGFALSAWITTSDLTGNDAILTKGKWNGTGYEDSAWNFKVNKNNGLRFELTSDGTSAPNDFVDADGGWITTNKWYHVVAQYNTTHISIYVDGNLNATDKYSSSIHKSNKNVLIGALNNNIDNYDGKLDEIRVYNRTLSDSEIESLYFQGVEGTFKGNYTTSKIDTSSEQKWENLTINTSNLPSETDVDATFRALDSAGSIVDTQNIDLSSGNQNYSLSVSNSEDAEIFLRGNSSNATKTWEIDDLYTYYSNINTETSSVDGLPDNITLELNLDAENVYSDGSEIASSSYATQDIDYPYIVSDQPTGIVSYSKALKISYKNISATEDKFSITQSGGSFLIPHTNDGYQVIEERRDVTENRDLLNKLDPSFSFPFSTITIIKVAYMFQHNISSFEGRKTDIEQLTVRNELNGNKDTKFILKGD